MFEELDKLPEDFLDKIGHEFVEIRDFFLNEAFLYAHKAAQYAMASEIFTEFLREYTPENWTPKLNERMELEDDEVISKLSDFWQRSLKISSKYPRALKLNTELSSQDLAGHAIFLCAYIEATLNFNLERLSNSGTNFIESMDRTEIIPKAILIHYVRFNTKEVKIDGLKQLVRLRNKAVHYRAAHYGKIQLRLSDLLQIWKDIEFIDAELTEYQTLNITEIKKRFESTWVNGKGLDVAELTKIKRIALEDYTTLALLTVDALRKILIDKGVKSDEIDEAVKIHFQKLEQNESI